MPTLFHGGLGVLLQVFLFHTGILSWRSKAGDRAKVLKPYGIPHKPLCGSRALGIWQNSAGFISSIWRAVQRGFHNCRSRRIVGAFRLQITGILTSRPVPTIVILMILSVGTY
jgi:hypothetical protein